MLSYLTLAFPAIDPVAISIGPLAVRWYALAYIAGLLGGWLFARRLAASERLWGSVQRPPAAAVDDLLVYVAFGIILGGRLGYVLFYNLDEYLAHPQEIIAIWRGGMSFHGGLAGGAVAVILLARKYRFGVLSLFDLACAMTPIGLFFGRVANFINGELPGRPAPNFPYAIVFPDAGPLPRHPSQIYEAFAEGLLLFALLALAVRLGALRRPGLVSGLFAVGYAVARTTCEFFREPDVQVGFLFGQAIPFLAGGVTMGMLLCVPLFFIGVALIVIALRGRRGTQPVAA